MQRKGESVGEKIDSPKKKQIGEIIKNLCQNMLKYVKICQYDENGRKQKGNTRGKLLKEEK